MTLAHSTGEGGRVKVTEKVNKPPHLAAMTVEKGIMGTSVWQSQLCSETPGEVHRASSSVNICQKSPTTSSQERWLLLFFQLPNLPAGLLIGKLLCQNRRGKWILRNMVTSLRRVGVWVNSTYWPPQNMKHKVPYYFMCLWMIVTSPLAIHAPPLISCSLTLRYGITHC